MRGSRTRRDLPPERVESEETKAEPRPEEPRQLDDDDLKVVVGGWGGGGGQWGGGGDMWSGGG